MRLQDKNLHALHALHLLATAAGAILLSTLALAQRTPNPHLNPLIDLLAAHKAAFGLTAPVSPRNGTARTATDLAKETVTRNTSDFLFSSAVDGDVDRQLATFAGFLSALRDAAPQARHPVIVKTPPMASDRAKAIDLISRHLNLGVSGIVLAGVESADDVRAGLAAMRFKANGGLRPDTIGTAARFWGVTDAEYRRKADVWPLNPAGELVVWVSVDTRQALAHVREIAAVKGIGVLSPGASELRSAFTTTVNGQRTFDADAWASAVESVLAACQEFHVPCGYQATAADISLRMQQGFSVFLMNWTDLGFQAVDIGLRLAGR